MALANLVSMDPQLILAVISLMELQMVTRCLVEHGLYFQHFQHKFFLIQEKGMLETMKSFQISMTD